MSRTRSMLLSGAALIVAALVATPGVAQEPIHQGVDLLATGATGTTFVSFAADPIPADFFCPGSAPFHGDIRLQGVPLVTSPAYVAGETDTIVEHLNKAPFDSDGVAISQIRVVAVQLEDLHPITIRCDSGYRDFHVAACKARGVEQPVTKIEIVNTFGDGGFFRGELEVIVDLAFIDAASGITLPPIKQHILMKVLENNRWMYKVGLGGVEVPHWFGVDTRCDGQPDTGVPGTTNFFPGWNPDMPDCYSKTVEDEGCHENPGGEHVHCVGTPCSKG